MSKLVFLYKLVYNQIKYLNKRKYMLKILEFLDRKLQNKLTIATLSQEECRQTAYILILCNSIVIRKRVLG